MEDEDEIQSHLSPDSGSRSPSSSPENGRITVTVAAGPPSQPQKALMLALPIQQPRTTNNGGGGGGGGGGREDCWSEGATSVLIDAWGERYLELSRGNLKQKHWKEVADIVSGREGCNTKTPKTDIQCKNRIDTVKKKYKLEKAKISSGGGPSKWQFFERLDRLIGPAAKASTPSAPAPFKVPTGIPVGIRSGHHYPPSNHVKKNQHQQQQQQQQNQKQKIQFRNRPPPVDSDSSDPDSLDSFPPGTAKRPRTRKELNSNAERSGLGGAKEKWWGNSVRELTQAILKFGEAYEQAESSKLEQIVEMEKQRMNFAKEMEIQRMQFFMKTQMEISQLRQGRKVGNNRHCSNDNNNNSDSSN